MRYIALLLFVFSAQNLAIVFAFPLPEWPYERLLEDSDVIVIVTLDKTLADPDASKISLEVDKKLEKYLSLAISRFDVKSCLKGEADGSLTLEHFRFRVGPHFNLGNGPRLVEFRSGVQTFSGPGFAAALEPEYLLFLKKTASGNYRLTGPPEYMTLSVRILFSPF